MLFKNIIGHSQIKAQLVKTVQQNRVAHAQLFYGKPGSVAYPLALAYAQYVNCSQPSSEDSCGKCSSCVQFAAGSFPDIHYSFPLVNPEGKTSKETSYDFIRPWQEYLAESENLPSLVNWQKHMKAGNKVGFLSRWESAAINKQISLKSYSGGKKIFIIWLPELFRIEGANRLLKTIEEPEGDALILLVSEDADRLITTITSRCQKLYVPLYQQHETSQWLATKGVEGQAAKQAAMLAEGNVHEALRIAEDNARFHEYAVLFRDWMRACLKARVDGIFSFVDALAKHKREGIKEALTFYIQTVELSLKTTVTQNKVDHPLYKKASFDLNKFAPYVNSSNAAKIHQHLTEAHRDINRNGNPQIVLSDCSFKMSNQLYIRPA